MFCIRDFKGGGRSMTAMDEVMYMSAYISTAAAQKTTTRADGWKAKLKIYATLFAVCCVVVVMFMDGMPLHGYSKEFGGAAVLVGMVLLQAAAYCFAMWRHARSAERNY